ncbi:hypothetical protein M569_14929 [Genlisea aurea]|uniref:Plus3 domain-containing protein n=1 Tax=Genlisea aurea TaxID=192259 RepID=S8BZB3_9LAMI|nr:hypothetical protein M569_14929 [Genlisea aurea]
MADLEKLLLEAAGRTTTSERNRPPSRRRRKHSNSDGGSDSRNDDSDGDHHYSQRKPSSSQVPLKKRFDPTDRDDRSSQDGDEINSNHERDSDNDTIGSDLYKDEEDREKLSKLTELEREMILEGRATKISDRDLTEKLKKRKGHDKKLSPAKAHTRSSTRSKAERAGALDELVKRRRDAVKGGTTRSRYSPVKRRSFTAATLSSPSHSDSRSQSGEGESTGDGGIGDSDEDKTQSQSNVPTFDDIKEITVQRSKLLKWFMEPFFDELIIGCFVKVGIGKSRSGNVYRLCVVRNVDSSDPSRAYDFENRKTHKYLSLVWGSESSAARWQMKMISNEAPKREEFDLWFKEVERTGGNMPTRQEVSEKREALQRINRFVYSAATVKQMVQEKKSATHKPINVALEKDRLRRAMEVARENDDHDEMKEIQRKLSELESSRKVPEKDSKAAKLAEMNSKNRKANFKNASEMKPVNTSLKAGEVGYDPFSRRWTRSRNYYVSNAATGIGEANGSANVASVAATAAALEAAAGAGKLVDTNAPVDQGTESNLLHDFELPISLAALQRLGGPQGAQAGLMARKQWIEANYGVKVPENDGRRHALTLTVSDYKRRRDPLTMCPIPLALRAIESCYLPWGAVLGFGFSLGFLD